MTTTLAPRGTLLDVRPLADALASAKTTTLLKTPHVKVLRMVLHRGEVLSDHRAPGEILVQCLEGRINFSALGQQQQLQAGDLLHLAAGEVHAVQAVQDASFLLTVLLPQDGSRRGALSSAPEATASQIASADKP